MPYIVMACTGGKDALYSYGLYRRKKMPYIDMACAGGKDALYSYGLYRRKKMPYIVMACTGGKDEPQRVQDCRGHRSAGVLPTCV